MQRWFPVPPAVYSFVEQTAGAVLLESSPRGEAGSCSRLFCSPSQILSATTPEQLNELFARLDEALREGLYAAGYLGYECGSWAEPAARQRAPEPGSPIAWIGLYPQCFEFDHTVGEFAGGAPEGLAAFSAPPPVELQRLRVTAGLDKASYAKQIAAIHEAIRAGDVYQLNFTFPLRFSLGESPAALYAGLRQNQPVPYGAFLNPGGGRHILSFSPELFFRVEAGPGCRRIVTKPMKGTVARGRTTAEDRARAEWLRNDAKNRAENVMIVDLLRNDLGRLCTFGSVKVPELFALERYETLWQMTSTVTGQLRTDVTCGDLVRALFPSGSVTGAPKVRAMQLLAELEDKPRAVYTGAVGYFAQDQAEFNVAIRTLELENGNGRMNVGSGIVIDSNAHDEYRECLLKGQFLTRRLSEFALIETMRWENGYPLLELHLDRLCDSAEYFGFACKREAVRASLQTLAGSFAENEMRKVRLLLGRDGAVQLSHEALTRSDLSEPVRLCLAAERTDSRDRFLFHKTTHRPVYAAGFAAARAAGFDDALFLNADGEVTETAIGNIFVQRNGRWFTPPVECGVLAGVYRRWLLSTRTDIDERKLTLDDVRAADGVYVCNAVRGLRRAVLT